VQPWGGSGDSALMHSAEIKAALISKTTPIGLRSSIGVDEL
jgi:hypothetical protein